MALPVFRLMELIRDLIPDFGKLMKPVLHEDDQVRGHPYMTSAKFWDFLTPSPLVRIWDFGTDLQY